MSSTVYGADSWGTGQQVDWRKTSTEPVAVAGRVVNNIVEVLTGNPVASYAAIPICRANTTEGRLILLALQLQSGEIGLEVYSAAVRAELTKAGW